MTELRVVAAYTIASGHTEEVQQLLRDLARAVTSEDGNLSFAAYQSIDDPDQVVLLERYVSREAFQAHRETSHFSEIVLDKIVPRLTSRVVEFYDVNE